jgi:ectoine hydroxylase-related dioxygenase (phytanoyl-CoA dioxygenase family)
MSLCTTIWENGFAVIASVLRAGELPEVLAALADGANRSRAGVRNLLANAAVRRVATSGALLGLAEEILGPNSFPFRATLFEKTPESNWRVTWHQDKALPITERRDVDGWGPWTKKAGIWHALTPAAALEPLVALRLHLDDSTESNGPLRVIPRTHSCGILSAAEVDRIVAAQEGIACTASRGSVVAMRPLILHASSKADSATPRRVLHIEYAPAGYHPHPELRLALP